MIAATTTKTRTTPPDPGVYRVDFETYLAWDCASASTLKQLALSPAHCREYLDNGMRETAPLRLGSAVHCAILEPDRWAREYIAMPNFHLQPGNVTGSGRASTSRSTVFVRSSVEAFEADHSGYEILTQDEYTAAEAARVAVHANATAHELLTGKGSNEISFVWRDEVTGELVKGRVDRFTDYQGFSCIVDAKAVASASEREFSRAIPRYGWDVQAPLYLDGLNQLDEVRGQDRKRRRYFWLAIEKVAPYACAVYEPDPEVLCAGRRDYRRLLRVWRLCRDSGQWPGYATGVHPIGTAPWAQDRYVDIDGTYQAEING